jgi:hypothetical protein
VVNEVWGGWSFLTNHAGFCWVSPTDARLRDTAASLGIRRSAYGIVTDLTAARYVVKQKDGRRNGRGG